MDGCFVVARFRARPGQGEEVASRLRDLLEPSRAEDGCLFYDLYRDLADRDLFVIVDGWRDRAAFDAHAGSMHVARTLAGMADHLDGGPAIATLEKLG